MGVVAAVANKVQGMVKVSVMGDTTRCVESIDRRTVRRNIIDEHCPFASLRWSRAA
jgi:hypothetical protein